MKKFWRIFLQVAVIVVASLVALVLLLVGGLNLLKFAIYADYYDAKTDICENPGLGDGLVCQGICAYETADKIFVSGYMADDSASRIYITDLEDNATYVTLTQNGEPFTGHVGGIATYEDRVYLADEGNVYILSATALLGLENGEALEIGEGIAVNNDASFVYADDNYLYVGEFHDGKHYFTEHPYDTADGTYYAIVERYTHDDLTVPDKVYSIRNKVQGICFTPDGKVVMSTSYGVADSVYYVYNEKDATDSGKTFMGAPVYYLDNCVSVLRGPAMSEGMDYFDGRVITLTESASNKYIFGKFFYANKIIGFDISRFPNEK